MRCAFCYFCCFRSEESLHFPPKIATDLKRLPNHERVHSRTKKYIVVNSVLQWKNEEVYLVLLLVWSGKSLRYWKMTIQKLVRLAFVSSVGSITSTHQRRPSLAILCKPALMRWEARLWINSKYPWIFVLHLFFLSSFSQFCKVDPSCMTCWSCKFDSSITKCIGRSNFE